MSDNVLIEIKLKIIEDSESKKLDTELSFNKGITELQAENLMREYLEVHRQLPIEELREQFEKEAPLKDYRYMSDIGMYKNKSIESRWRGWQECARNMNIINDTK